MTERRATPDDLPEPPERRRRGRLKVYLGYAAGVGKTWRMLEEAHALRAAGVDVVGALVEPHGRPEVAARVGDLELVPRRRVEHRGVAAEELDLEAALRRRPAVALVDELQHVNAPGSRNARRHQDVEDLLAAGVDVIGAVNVQHLESLNDLVERATGLRVRETVPDAFLEQADELVDLDLAVEDLQARLRAGAIYPPDRVAWAEAHLFAARSLATLRELALREVAESLERTARSGAVAGVPAPPPARGRLMACLASNPPRGAALLRRASRMAGRLATGWFAVWVETPREAPGRIEEAARRHLLDNLELARQLGAEVVRLEGDDPAAALLDFARSHRVSDVMVGRSRRGWWRRALGRSLPQRLLDEASDLDLHVVGLDEEERP